jgi:hypothetical protein
MTAMTAVIACHASNSERTCAARTTIPGGGQVGTPRPIAAEEIVGKDLGLTCGP